jgi:hypothetical protein
MRVSRGPAAYHSPASTNASPLRYGSVQGSLGHQGSLFMERSRSAAVVVAPTGMVYCPRAPRWIMKAVRAIGVAGWGGSGGGRSWTLSGARGPLETAQESGEEQLSEENPEGSGRPAERDNGAGSAGSLTAHDVVVSMGGGSLGATVLGNESFIWTLSGWRQSVREAQEREDARQLRSAFDREEMVSGYETPATGTSLLSTSIERRGGAALGSALSLTTRSPWAIIGALASWLEDRFFPLFGAEEAENIMAAAEGEMPRAARTVASSASSITGSMIDEETAANRRLQAALLRQSGSTRDRRVDALQYVLDQMIDPFCRAVLASFAAAATDSAASILGPLLFLYGHAYHMQRGEMQLGSEGDQVLMEEDLANMPRAIMALRTLTELYSELFSTSNAGFGRSRGNSSSTLNQAGTPQHAALISTNASSANIAVVPSSRSRLGRTLSTQSGNKASAQGSLSDAGEVLDAFATRAELLAGTTEAMDPPLASSLTTEPAVGRARSPADAAAAIASSSATLPLTGAYGRESEPADSAATSSDTDAALSEAVKPLRHAPATETERPELRAAAGASAAAAAVGAPDVATMPQAAAAAAAAVSQCAFSENDRTALLEAALARIEALEREVDFLNRELAAFRDDCVSSNRDLHNCVDAWTAIVLSETRSVAATERATIRALARRLRKLERQIFSENVAATAATSPEHSNRGESRRATRASSERAEVQAEGYGTASRSAAEPWPATATATEATETTEFVAGKQGPPTASFSAQDSRLLYSEISSDDPTEAPSRAMQPGSGAARGAPTVTVRSPSAGPVAALSYLLSEHGSFGSDEDPLLTAFQRAVGLGNALGSGDDTGESASSTPRGGTPRSGGLHGPGAGSLQAPAQQSTYPSVRGAQRAIIDSLPRSTSGSNMVRISSPMLSDPMSGSGALSSSLPVTSSLRTRVAPTVSIATGGLPENPHTSRRILRDGKWVHEEAASSPGAAWGRASASRASRREREAVLRRQIESMQVALEEERQRRQSLEERLLRQ